MTPFNISVTFLDDTDYDVSVGVLHNLNYSVNLMRFFIKSNVIGVILWYIYWKSRYSLYSLHCPGLVWLSHHHVFTIIVNRGGFNYGTWECDRRYLNRSHGHTADNLQLFSPARCSGYEPVRVCDSMRGSALFGVFVIIVVLLWIAMCISRGQIDGLINIIGRWKLFHGKTILNQRCTV